MPLAGYAKTLGVAGRVAGSDDLKWAHASRLRLEGRTAHLDGRVKWRLTNDTEFLHGTLLAARGFAAAALQPASYWLDLDAELVDEPDRRLVNRVHRAELTLAAWELTATLGRQRIAWGTGRVWNPTDVLNPYNPLAVERDERPGVDAALLAYPLGDLGKASAVHARYRKDAATLGRVAGHTLDTDAALMGGRVRPLRGNADWYLAGGEFATQVWEAGVRGEIGEFFAQGHDPILRADLSADRAFAGTMTAGAEYYFDNTPYTHHWAGSYGWEVTPLVRLDLLTILNGTDRSTATTARLLWSVIESAEVVVGGTFPQGRARTEFGPLRPSGFLWGTWFF